MGIVIRMPRTFFVWLWANILRNLPIFAIGFAACVLYLNITAGPGSIVKSEGEAEGQAYNDPDTIDLKNHVTFNRPCAAQSQRWALRWEDPVTHAGVPPELGESKPDYYDQHFIPLAGTVAPALAKTGNVIITVSARDVPDRLQKDAYWQYRVVTEERCNWMPQVITDIFGPRLKQSPDQPLNFIGASHK